MENENDICEKISFQRQDYLTGDKIYTGQKRSRRSKTDQHGRDFYCKVCGKAYLSQPALSNHRNTKHEYVAQDIKRGRGRPKKEVLIINLAIFNSL